MKVGFIGLGRMGRGMARRILDGGHDLAVYDVVRAQMTAIESAGARAASSVADVCQGREVVVTMLVEDATVIDTAVAPGGLRDALAPGAIHLAMGTYGVAAIRTLAAAHAAAQQVFVAAPVLGRPEMAAAGQLGIVAAGPPEAVARCEPLFECLGSRTIRPGDVPEGATAIKLAHNLVLGCALVAMAEGFSLVRKYGVDPEVFYKVMVEGLFSSPPYKGYGRTMVDESYDQVGSPVTVGLKDANLIKAAADLAHVPLPALDVYRDRLLGAVEHGDGDKDQAVVAREQARASGLE
jgi:3-hydroxyisobutyrate dehydrogenase-like beta-hydroxyacid dehydrogenase